MGGCHISMVDRAGCAVAVTGLVLLSVAKAHSAALSVTVTESILIILISPCIRATGPASLRGLNRRSHIGPGARSRIAEGNRNARQNRDERRSRADTRNRLFEGAVVMRDQRDYHVGRVSAPMSFEHPNLLFVEHPDDHLHQRDQLGRAQRPTPPQHDVVDFLKLNARQFSNNIDRIQKILDTAEPHLPWTLLFADDRFQGLGGFPMAAAGVNVDELDLSLAQGSSS
jgi:hypothetical protein